jgi:DNA invertase Pin-like site-specific DNA recombinase
MASLAEFEGRVIYERLSKGKRKKASEGGYTGGWVPYGYRRRDDGTIAVVPEEAAVVERIFRWAAEGRSLPAIAKALRDEKAPTRNGGAWRPSTIRGMLRNRFYTSRVEYDGTIIRARHDAIVSDLLFREATHPNGS